VSNFAAILAPLAISGSRKSDGTANDSGKVYAYLPGTLTTTSIYADASAETVVTQPITLDSAGRLPRADFPDGVFIARPVRLLIQDSSGSTVSDSVYVPSTAGATGVDNDGFSDSTLDDVLDDAFTSFGGVDWKYKESGGATSRTVKAKFAERGIAPEDFGAVGDGVAIDTTAVQAAFNRAKVLSCPVIVAGGKNYKCDQAITLTSATGVSILGAGSGASTFTFTNGSADGFTFTSCTTLQISGIKIAHSSSSTGNAITLSSCTSPSFTDVVHNGGSSSGFRIVISLTSSTSAKIILCTLTGEASNAAARGLYASSSGAITMVGGSAGAAAGYAFEAAGNTANCTFLGTTLGTARFAAGLSGSEFYFVGCPGLGLSVATATNFPVIEQWQSPPYSSSVSGATGTAVTPSLVGGKVVQVTATGGVGTLTVNNPALLPTTAGLGRQYWEFWFINSTAGACTWALDTNYRLAASIPTTFAHTVIIRFEWDGTYLREVARTDTVTA